MIKIKFHRYFSDGSLSFDVTVPDELIAKYNLAVNSLPRMKVWATKEDKVDVPGHIINSLFRDVEFKEVAQLPLLADQGNFKFLKSFDRHASNFYFTFINSEDGGKIKTRKVKKTSKELKFPRVKKEKKVKVVDEKKVTFKNLKSRTKKKLQYIQKMHNWQDPNPMRYTDHEHFLKLTCDIFKSYRDFFEENLNARGINFYVSNHAAALPTGSRWANLFVEYVLVNNTASIDQTTLNKQDWKKITLAWFPGVVRSEPDEWEHRRRMIALSFKKIGMAMEDHDSTRRGRIKSFSNMQESKFAELVNNVYEANNITYVSKLESFKSIEERRNLNIAEELELKNYITKNIIPFVPENSLSGEDCDFRNHVFKVALKAVGCYRQLEILQVSTGVDNLENLEIAVEFMDLKIKNFNKASDAIKILDDTFVKNISVLISTFNKMLG